MPVPTVNHIKFRFPQFKAFDDGTVEFAIEEAVVACGNGAWVDEANRTLGLMYYTAHLLQVALMRAESGTGQIVSSERTPDLSVTYSVPDPNSPIDFNMTFYGERYEALVKSNFPGVLVVNSGVAM